MFKYSVAVIFTVLALCSVSCSDNSKQNQFQKVLLQGKTMGTHYHVSLIINANSPTNYSKKLQNDIDDLLTKINQQMSTYLENSEISRFNQHQSLGWFPVSSQLFDVIKSAQQINKLTGGAFDITIASLVNLWGFGPAVQYTMPDSQKIHHALELTGNQLIEIHENPPSIRKTKPLVKIDLSAIAKGYAVDQISRYLTAAGFTNHLVEIGGEIIAKGHNKQNKAWQIKIEHPTGSSATQPHVIEVQDFAVATSGDYRNYFIKANKRYSHTLDPITGNPVTHHLASISVLDKSAMKADALATALMVMGEKKGISFASKHKIPAFFIIRQSDKSYQYWSNIKSLKTH